MRGNAIAIIREVLSEAVKQAREGKVFPIGLLVCLTLVTLLLVKASVSLMFLPKDSRCAVEGIVRINGEAIRQGEVTFSPITSADGQRRSTLISNGLFSLPRSRGLLRNHDYAVEVRGLRPTGETYQSHGQTVDQLEQFVSARFNAASELRVRPSSRSERLEFDLTQ